MGEESYLLRDEGESGLSNNTEIIFEYYSVAKVRYSISNSNIYIYIEGSMRDERGRQKWLQNNITVNAEHIVF